jgi:hypothetical protein
MIIVRCEKTNLKILVRFFYDDKLYKYLNKMLRKRELRLFSTIDAFLSCFLFIFANKSIYIYLYFIQQRKEHLRVKEKKQKFDLQSIKFVFLNILCIVISFAKIF